MNDIIKNDYKDLIMICEDDIKFIHKGQGRKVLNKMITRDNLQNYNIYFEKPILIRCEHRKKMSTNLTDLSLTNRITMSIACFLINILFAQSFLTNLKEINTTSDIYLHRKLLNEDKNTTFYY